MGLAGFVIGRTTASPQTITETIRELVEVTREVPVPVEPESGDTAAQGTGNNSTAAPEQPTPPPVKATEPGNRQTPSFSSADEIDLAVFYEVWNLIGEEFDGDIPPAEDVLYSAISGSLEELDDDFTRFIRPEVAARLREDMGGSVSGIGAFVRENDDGMFEIVFPIEGQPADLAGLLPGDIIIGVDGQSVVGISFDEVILMVRGPSGTTVNLTILREGEADPIEFSIVRARFEVPVVESEMLPDQIAYIRLLEFNGNAETKVLEAMDELLAQNPKGLILDLRNNPGGFLNQSVAVADAFLPEGVVLFERDRQGGSQTFRSDDGDAGEKIPLVVLVNEGSASASEIVAGAIKDRGRGILIGSTTFGKGSVQSVHQLSDGSELRVTIARWYTPNDNSIDKNGITPDIEVPTPEQIGGEDDAQIQRAVEYLLTGE